MAEWSIAVRNLLRNRRRSLSTLIALAIGLSAVLLFSGFKANLIYTGLTAYARAGGHVQIQHRDYFLYGSGNPTAYGIADYERLLGAIRADPLLKPLLAVATPMLRFGGLAGNFDAGISRTVIGTGYVASDVTLMRQWNEFGIPIVRPRFALEGTAQDAAVLGVGLARVLQLCEPLRLDNCPPPQTDAPALNVGGPALAADIAALALSEHGPGARTGPRAARIEILSSSSRGAPNVAGLTVVAAEDQGFKELDEVSAIVHLTQAQRLVFGRSTPRITAVMILLSHTADEGAATRRLRELLAGDPAWKALVVRDFTELNPFYVQTEQMFDVIFGFIFALIAAIVLFTVSNTMNAAVVERTVEIGTLRAIGLRQAGVRRLFVIEGFILGCVGALTGLVAAVITGELVNRSGVTWLPPGSSERLLLQLRVLGDHRTLIGTTISLIVIAAASAWWPAWRAARLNMVDALRHA
jgi:putative ABC transport system permease protein